MKLLRKLLITLPITSFMVITGCSCNSSNIPTINIVKHEHISVTYDKPKNNQDLVLSYKLDTGYSVGDVRV